jgi:hypothetical protein
MNAGLSTGEYVGIVIGVLVAFLVIVVIVFLFVSGVPSLSYRGGSPRRELTLQSLSPSPIKAPPSVAAAVAAAVAVDEKV